MKPTLPLFILSLLFFPFAAQAEDAVIGAGCSTLGLSQMSADQTTIAVCLKDTATGSNLVWKSMAGAGAPSGTIAFFYLVACPTGWNVANGTNGTIDVRGRFLRALDLGVGLDPNPSRAVGSAQGDAMRNLSASFSAGDAAVVSGTLFRAESGYGAWFGHTGDGGAWQETLSFDASRAVPTSTENRPVNVALLACQKM